MPDEREIAKAFKIHGRVQGVGFRWWAQRHARSLGLRGTVRNCPDGTVEVVLAGAPDAVTEMAARLQEGPAGALVRRIETVPAPATIPDDFRIAL